MGAMAASDRLRIVSHFPGRLRVRSVALRDAALVDSVAEQLRGEEGVTAVTSAALTGSLLVEYDAQTVQLPWLVQLIVQIAGLEGIAADHKELVPLDGKAIRATTGRWNDNITRLTGVDARVAVPGTLAGLGILTLLFGRRQMPVWYDLLFWSFVTFQNLNHAKVEPTEANGQ